MKVFSLNDNRALVFGRYGMFLVNRNDFYIGKALEIYGEYMQAEANTFAQVLSEGDTVIEVGANIGAHTVGLARMVGPRGRVYAYEPQRACHALLQSQIALNELDQIIAIPEGCGAQKSTLWHAPYDYAQRGNFGGVALSAEAAAGYVPVTVRTLDDVHTHERVKLLKVDVEGMERDVLLGGRRLIEAQKPILYVENDRIDKSEALLDLIFGLNYRAWWHVCPLFNPNNYLGHADNVYGAVYAFNMICMPADTPLDSNVFSGEIKRGSPHPLAKRQGKPA